MVRGGCNYPNNQMDNAINSLCGTSFAQDALKIVVSVVAYVK